MASFSEWIGLKDLGRDSLEPDPERDTDLYIDLDGLIDRATARLASKAPKLVIAGDYGTGKTHLLHVLKDRMDKSRFQPIYLKLNPYGRVAEARHLHDEIVSALERNGLLAPAIKAPPEDLDRDVKHAFSILSRSHNDPTARAWLLGRGPTPTQALRAGFSARLVDSARGITFATIWKALGDSFQSTTHRELILLLDESETFQEVVDPTRAADLGVAVREMVDVANKSYGVLLGLTAPKARGGDMATHPLGRPDVLSRVQNVTINMPGLGTSERRRAFIEGLLLRLFRGPQPLLAEDALRVIAERGDDIIRNRNRLRREPVQREYVKFVSDLALQAYTERKSLPLHASDVESGGSI